MAQMTGRQKVLLIGADNFPFPIPLRRRPDAGQWFFETAAGKEEILTRRSARNELASNRVCGAIAERTG